MLTNKLKHSAAVLLATVMAGGSLLAQPALAPKPANSTEMTQTEAKVARLRELIRPLPGEHVANMARIAWERDPWQAAVKAAREGKPVLAYGEGMHGIPCGFG